MLLHISRTLLAFCDASILFGSRSLALAAEHSMVIYPSRYRMSFVRKDLDDAWTGFDLLVPTGASRPIPGSPDRRKARRVAWPQPVCRAATAEPTPLRPDRERPSAAPARRPEQPARCLQALVGTVVNGSRPPARASQRD